LTGLMRVRFRILLPWRFLRVFSPAPITLLLLMVVAPVTSQEARLAPLSDFVRSSWAMNERWNDGLAEIATYEAERIVDGAPRGHVLRLVTVQEDFNREFNVKADWPHGQKPIVAVMRQSQLTAISTPGGGHNLMSSVFVERSDAARLVKMSISSQQLSGITHKEFDFSGPLPRWTWASHRDGEGSGSETLRGWPDGAVFEEQLPMLVRALELREGLEAGLALAPNQTTGKAERPEPVGARLRAERPQSEIRVPAGTWQGADTWRVSIEATDGRAMEFVITDEQPRLVLAWSINDGRFHRLQNVRREAPGQIRDEAID